MARFQLDVDIASDVQAVFDAMTDPARMPRGYEELKLAKDEFF